MDRYYSRTLGGRGRPDIYDGRADNSRAIASAVDETTAARIVRALNELDARQAPEVYVGPGPEAA